ncbi:hypothetical protein Tco_1472700 [Tanacetum coccineum]
MLLSCRISGELDDERTQTWLLLLLLYVLLRLLLVLYLRCVAPSLSNDKRKQRKRFMQELFESKSNLERKAALGSCMREIKKMKKLLEDDGLVARGQRVRSNVKDEAVSF